MNKRDIDKMNKYYMEEIKKIHYTFNGIKFPAKVQTNEQRLNAVIQSTRIIVMYKDDSNRPFMDSNGAWFTEKEIDFKKYSNIDTVKSVNNNFEKIVRPVLKYLCDNHHPHTTVVITPTTAELLEGIKSIGIVTDYVLD